MFPIEGSGYHLGMRPVVVQGMRRSGTTSVFDLFSQDPSTRHLYEPLAIMSPSMGGGSGVQKEDLFGDVRLLRDQFAEAEGVDAASLNFGAPSNPSLEFLPDFSPTVERYLRSVFDSAEPTFAKFTRLYSKVGAFKAIAPNAVFVHLARNPWHMVISYLAGYQRRKEHLMNLVGPTRYRPHVLPWSATSLAKLAAEATGFGRDWWSLSGAQRVLVLWRFVNEKTIEDGRAAFKDNFQTLKHEDFVLAPQAHAGLIYEKAGLQLPKEMSAWIRSGKIRDSGLETKPPPDGWRRILGSVGAEETARGLGYL